MAIYKDLSANLGTQYQFPNFPIPPRENGRFKKFGNGYRVPNLTTARAGVDTNRLREV